MQRTTTRSEAISMPSLGVCGYDVVRHVLATILVAAAALKAHQLATEPTFETSLFTSRWFLSGVVEFELLLGLALLLNVYPKWTWRVSLGCFALFACVSLQKALSGDSFCGCFGRLPVNPWHTFAIDASAVAALLLWPANTRDCNNANLGRARMTTLLALWFIVGLPAAWSIASFNSIRLSDIGTFLDDSDIIVLEPDAWIGKPFPLVQHSDIGNHLNHGDWTVLLYHRDCSKCQEVLPEYERFAEQLATDQKAHRVAALEIPLYTSRSGSPPERSQAVLWGRLSATHEWAVETPIELVVEAGTVIAVRGGRGIRDAYHATRCESMSPGPFTTRDEGRGKRF